MEDRNLLEEYARRRCLVLPLDGETALCRVLGKHLIYVPIRDRSITPHLCLNGFWESWITLALMRRVQPGWQCVDVGANCGYYTALLADAVGQYGRVLAVEPNPQLADLLRWTARTNGFGSQVVVEVLAAAAVDGQFVKLQMAKFNFGGATMCDHIEEPAGVFDARTTTIDRLVRSWARVDFIKIDVEGAEETLWDGMTETLARNRDIRILMEFTPTWYRDAAAFLERIRAAGLQLRHVDFDAEIKSVAARELLASPSDREQWMLYLTRE